MTKISNLSRSTNDYFGLYPLKNEKKIWQDLADLRCLIRYKSLEGELECTPPDHQIMRPMKEEEFRDDHTNIKYVKNGQNPQMAYTQVHYLKGHFLLHHLCDLVTVDSFFSFLRLYIDLYHGRLVHSSDFLRLFFQTFEKQFKDQTIEQNINEICRIWLDKEDMPQSITRHCQTISNQLLCQVSDALKKKNSKHRNTDISGFLPEQMILFLEGIISKVPKMKQSSKLALIDMKDHINLHKFPNADVMHRWCELIVLCQWKSEFSLIKDFLLENQAMGIYLYSELMLSQDSDCRQLAENIFEEINQELDASTRCNIQNILH